LAESRKRERQKKKKGRLIVTFKQEAKLLERRAVSGLA
jgi:hypothetical protein